MLYALVMDRFRLRSAKHDRDPPVAVAALVLQCGSWLRWCFTPKSALERVNVQVRLGQQLLELGVLSFEFTQPVCIR